MRNCGWCAEPFEPAETNQQYCNRGHAHAARKRRHRLRKTLANTTASQLCPTPLKRSYSSHQQAAIIGTYELADGQELYLCACGGLHYGHSRREKIRDDPKTTDPDLLAQRRA